MNKVQLRDSDLNYSVWVSASAGTGKTKILIDRILRLLLEGVDIDKIICITYSKKAANEMQERLLATLANWAISNFEDLDAEIQELCGYTPSEEQLELASKLFSYVLNRPQEIKIQTIHSFCQSLLAKFPLEAGLTPNFITLEENASFVTKIKEQILQETLQQYYKFQEKADILNILIKKMGKHNFQQNIYNVLNNLKFIDEIYNAHKIDIQGKNSYKEELYNFLQVDPKQSSDQIKQEFLNNIPKSAFEFLDNILQHFENSPISYITDHLKFLSLYKNLDETKLKEWLSLFVAQNNNIRKFSIKSPYKKQLEASVQEQIITILNQEAERIIKYKENYNKAVNAEISYAFSHIAFDIFAKYQDYKQKSNFLDYDDQVIKAVYLLTKRDIMPWIMFKLDSTIEHILVDEAQDTTPLQWEIIKAFAKEFFSGESAHEEKKPTPRTIFVVGDIKQSIYHFQGANPNYLNHVKQYLKSLVTESKNSWLELPLTTSYRSAPGIINFVNKVTANLFNNTKSPYLNENLEHSVYEKNITEPCQIEIWPAIIKNKEAILPYYHNINLAKTIVNKIISLHQDHNINYKDIYILYAKRKNNVTLDYLIKILKDKNIPVLGLDKINLNNNIVTQDLIALIKFILSNHDNLSLACLLKSPLFNLTDDILLSLKEFDDNNLFQSLKTSPYKYIYNELSLWIKIGLEDGIVALLYKVLYIEKGINKFASRLGEDCKDLIHEFLNIAIAFVNENNNTLSTFLYHIEEQSLDIKRDISNNQDYINLLTIHASKGLQAKAVFLLNDVSSSSKEDTVIFTPAPSNLIISVPKKENTPSLVGKLLEDKNREELEGQKRLLYVALTRSKNYLYICTIANKREDLEKENSWYTLLTNNVTSQLFTTFRSNSFSQELGFITKEFLLLNEMNIHLNSNLRLPITQKTTIPSWFYKKAPTENNLVIPLAPSKLNFDDSNNSSPLVKNKKNTLKIVEKGLLIHTILEQINKLNIADAPFIIESFVAQRNLSQKDKKDIIDSINNVINNPALQFLFTNPSVNEIALSGLVEFNNNQYLLLGRVDKIVKIKDTIIVIDYKYSRFKGTLAPNYVDQLTLYKNILQKIYPNFMIKAYIIFTTDGTLKEV